VLLATLLATATLGSADSQPSGRPNPDRPKPDAESVPGEPAAEAPRPTPSLPIEFQPYRVQVQIAFERAAQFGDEFRHSVLKRVREGVDLSIGEFWQCTVTEEQGKLYSGLTALNRLRYDTIHTSAVLPDMHKVYLLAVQVEGARFRVAGRECDTVTRQLGPLA